MRTPRFEIIVLGVALSGCQAFDRQRFASIVADVPVDVPVVERDAASCVPRAPVEDGGCGGARFPALPTGVVEQRSNGRSYVLGMRSIAFIGSGRDGWQQFGFDLDGVCSYATDQPMRTSCQGAQIEDGINGRDNTFGLRIVPLLALAEFLVEGRVNASIASGLVLPALRFTEWSGGDDAHVSVEFLTVVRGQPPAGSAAFTWDGRDSWQIETALSLNPMGQAQATSSEAFVSCGWTGISGEGLVPLYVPHNGNVRRIIFRRPRVGGLFAPDVGGTLDFSGFNTRADIVANLPWIDLCPAPGPNASTRESLLQTIGDSFDVLTSGQVSPSQPCDAMSAAVRTEWAPISLRENVAVPELSADQCAVDGGTVDSGVVDAGARD